MPTRAVSVPRAYIEMFLDRLDAIRCLRSRRHSPPGHIPGCRPSDVQERSARDHSRAIHHEAPTCKGHSRADLIGDDPSPRGELPIPRPEARA
jgi:hypothetical protein